MDIASFQNFGRKNEKTVSDRKAEKARLTFLADKHKLKPLVIEKPRNPRCCNIFSPSVDYDSSNKRVHDDNGFFKVVSEFICSAGRLEKHIGPLLRLHEYEIVIFFVRLAQEIFGSKGFANKGHSFIGQCFESSIRRTCSLYTYMSPNVLLLIQAMDLNVIRISKLYYRSFLLVSSGR